jgi:hypothetical protein
MMKRYGSASPKSIGEHDVTHTMHVLVRIKSLLMPRPLRTSLGITLVCLARKFGLLVVLDVFLPTPRPLARLALLAHLLPGFTSLLLRDKSLGQKLIAK